MLSIGQLLASILLLTSALWLPWATYRSPGVYVVFRTGLLDQVVVVCGVAGVIGAAIALRWEHTAVQWFLCSAGGIGIVTSVALALSKIKAANDFHVSRAVAGTLESSATSYGMGSILGFASSVVLLVLSLIHLRSVRQHEPEKERIATG